MVADLYCMIAQFWPCLVVWSGDLVTDPMERIPGYHNVNSDYPHLQSWTSLCTMHKYKAMLLRFGPCRLWLNCWQVSPKVVKIWNQAMIEKESCDQGSIRPPCPGIMRSGGELSWLFLGVSHFIVTVLSLSRWEIMKSWRMLWRAEEKSAAYTAPVFASKPGRGWSSSGERNYFLALFYNSPPGIL